MQVDRGARLAQTLIAAGILAVAAAMAVGAVSIPSAAGYAGVGPDFLPWVVSLALAACGALLLWQARHGGFREPEAASGAERGEWRSLAWVVAGVVANAALIETVGFVAACALCYGLAVRGLRAGEGRPAGGALRTVLDLATGAAIAAPVFWLFTRVLSVNLPALGASGWI